MATLGFVAVAGAAARLHSVTQTSLSKACLAALTQAPLRVEAGAHLGGAGLLPVKSFIYRIN